jgi:hypothetical protein
MKDWQRASCSRLTYSSGWCGLRDAAGAAHHGADARLLEQPRLGAEAHQGRALLAGQSAWPAG